MPLTIPEYITVKTAGGATAAYLSPSDESGALKDAWVERELNARCTLTLSLPLSSPKWLYLSDGYRIYAPDITGKMREFVIQNPDAIEKKRDGGKLWGQVTAHESWTLLGSKLVDPGISNDPQTPSPPALAVIILSGGSDLSGGLYPVGSAGHALYALLQGTGWTVGTVDVTGTHDLETEKESKLANIQKVQEIWGGYLLFDSVAKTVSLRDETLWAPYTGYQIRYKKNEKSIVRTDDTKVITKLYPFGENDLDIGSVNGGQIYIENKSYTTEELADTWINQDITDPQKLMDEGTKYLANVCKPRYNYRVKHVDLRLKSGYQHEDYDLGHLTDLIDEELGIDDRARIISYKFNVFQPWNPDLEVGDPLKKIEATLLESMQAANYLNSIKTSRGQITAYKLVDESLIAEKIAKAAVDATKLNTKTVILFQDTWTDNSPAGGSVAWNQHKLYYAGVEHIIVAGSTAQKYIHWDGVANTYFTSADMPTLADGQFVIAMNNGGLHDTVWDKGYAREFIGSALIADAAILSAHIGEAQILDAHIANLSANKITTGQLLAYLVEIMGKNGYFKINGDEFLVYDKSGALMGRFGHYETLAAQLATFTRASTAYDTYGTFYASGVPRYEYMHQPAPVWQDTFDTDQLSSQYTSGGDTPATWAAADGVLTVTGGTHATLIKNNLLLQDAVIEITCDQSARGFAVARYQDNNNYYLLYAIDNTDNGGTGIIGITKRVSGSFINVGAVSINFSRGVAKKFKYSLCGSTLEAWFDGVKMVSVIDTTFTGGGVGLRQHAVTAGTTTRFFDFAVYKVQRAVMVEEGTTNLLTANQASVETDLAGLDSWSANGQHVLSRDTTVSWHGSASAKLVSNYSGSQRLSINTQTALTVVTPGIKYAHSSRMKVQASGLRSCSLNIRWYDASYAFISDSNGVFKYVGPVWNELIVIGTAPANAAFCNVYCFADAMLQNEAVWWDGLQLEAKSIKTSFQLPGTTRAVEVLAVPTVGVLSASEGEISIDAYIDPNGVHSASNPNFNMAFAVATVQASPYLEMNQISFRRSPSSQTWSVYFSNSSGSGASVSLGSITTPGIYRITASWKSGIGGYGYLNGVLKGSVASTYLPSAFNTAMTIGAWDSTGALPVNSPVSNFRVLNKMRTDAEVLADYATGLPLSVTEYTTCLMSCDGTLQPTVRGFGLWSQNGRFILQDPKTGQGIEVWDGTTRKVLIGRLDDGTIGQEIVGGRLYSSSFRTGSKTDTTYIALEGNTFRAKVNNNVILEIEAAIDDGNLFFSKASDGSWFGRILRYTDLYPGLTIESVGTGLSLRSAGNIDTILGSGSNVFTAHGNFNATGGSKNCVEETSQGMVALSVRESPDIRYIDENRAMLANGECKIDVDPLFMECTLPNSEETPWLIHLTPTSPEILYVSEIGDGYFTIKSSEQTSNSMFFWKLSAVRKGYAGVRFQKFYSEGDVLTSNWEDAIIEELNASEERV